MKNDDSLHVNLIQFFFSFRLFLVSLHIRLISAYLLT